MDEKDWLKEAYALVAAAIGIPMQRAAEIVRIHEPLEWDSEGHLCIIISLEELIGAEIRQEDTVERLTELNEIVAFLKESSKEEK